MLLKGFSHTATVIATSVSVALSVLLLVLPITREFLKRCVARGVRRERGATLVVRGENCDGCRRCVGACPERAISINNGKVAVETRICLLCGNCAAVCPKGVFEIRGCGR
jgi:Fe-S-cluster-containing hydrogenase component 2